MGLLDRFRSKPPPKQAEKPRGRSGTLNAGGFLQDRETSTALIWPTNLETYDDMKRTDPTVRWLLALVKYPILAATWSVEPPEDANDQEREAAAFCEHALHSELDGGFYNLLRQALTFEEFGHSVFELAADYRAVEFAWESDDGERHEVSRDAFVIARLAPRLQRTILKWVPEDSDSSKLAWIVQWLGDGRGEQNPEIERDRLVVFSRDQEGDDWRGVSILRSAHRDWLYKQDLENLEAIAIERSTGVPVVYMPGATDDEQSAMEDALTQLRQKEVTYLLVSKAKWAPTNPDGWLIETLDVKGSAGEANMTDSAIQRHEAGMARNILAEWMRLGHEQTGARAVGDVQQDPYWQGIEAEVRMLEDVFNEQVIAPLVAWNYDVKRAPKLRATKIQAKNIEVISKAVAALITAEALIPDAPMEDWLRDVLDAPEARRESGDDPFAVLLERKLNPPEPPATGSDGKPVPGSGKPPGSAGGGTPPKPGTPPKGPPPRSQKVPPVKASEHRFTGFAPFEPDYRRPLTPVEQAVAFSEIQATLDSGEAQIIAAAELAATAALADARKQADAAVQHKSPEAVAALDVDPAPIAAALTDVLVSLYDNGRSQVAAEIQRQGGKVTMADKLLPPLVERAKRIRALADTAAASIAAAATRALRAVTLRRIEGQDATGPGYDPLESLLAEAKRAAAPLVSQAFADGRSDEILVNQDELDATVYSAILDDNTCESCEASDGIESPPGDPEVECPNPDCYGGGRCRCMLVPVVSAEASGLSPGIGPGYVVQ